MAVFEQLLASSADKLSEGSLTPFANEEHDDMPMAIEDTSPHLSPELSPTAASFTLTRSDSSTSVALDEYRSGGASSEPPVNFEASPDGLVNVLSNAEPLSVTASSEVGPRSMSVELEEALEHASSLLNDDQSTAAMHSLALVAERLPEAQNQ